MARVERPNAPSIQVFIFLSCQFHIVAVLSILTRIKSDFVSKIPILWDSKLNSFPVNDPGFNKRHHSHKMPYKQDHMRQNSLFGLHNRLIVLTISRFMNAKLSYASISIHNDSFMKFQIFVCRKIASWFQIHCSLNPFRQSNVFAIFQVA